VADILAAAYDIMNVVNEHMPTMRIGFECVGNRMLLLAKNSYVIALSDNTLKQRGCGKGHNCQFIADLLTRLFRVWLVERPPNVVEEMDKLITNMPISASMDPALCVLKQRIRFVRTTDGIKNYPLFGPCTIDTAFYTDMMCRALESTMYLAFPDGEEHIKGLIKHTKRTRPNNDQAVMRVVGLREFLGL